MEWTPEFQCELKCRSGIHQTCLEDCAQRVKSVLRGLSPRRMLFDRFLEVAFDGKQTEDLVEDRTRTGRREIQERSK